MAINLSAFVGLRTRSYDRMPEKIPFYWLWTVGVSLVYRRRWRRRLRQRV